MTVYLTRHRDILGCRHVDGDLLTQGFTHIPVDVPSDYVCVNAFIDLYVRRYAMKFRVHPAPLSTVAMEMVSRADAKHSEKLVLVGDGETVDRTIRAAEKVRTDVLDVLHGRQVVEPITADECSTAYLDMPFIHGRGFLFVNGVFNDDFHAIPVGTCLVAEGEDAPVRYASALVPDEFTVAGDRLYIRADISYTFGIDVESGIVINKGGELSSQFGAVREQLRAATVVKHAVIRNRLNAAALSAILAALDLYATTNTIFTVGMYGDDRLVYYHFLAAAAVLNSLKSF